MTATISRPSTVSLTAKESALFDAIADGMDEPGSGWLHELADPSRSVSAVLGSLIKKGLVRSSGNMNERGEPPIYWIELTAAGFAAVAVPAAVPAGPCLPVIKPAAAPAVRPAATPTGRPAAAPAGPCLPIVSAAAPTAAERAAAAAAGLAAAAAGLAAANDHEPNHDAGYQLTDKSDNKKTGPIPVSTTTRSSCSPTCAFVGNGCYAETSHLSWHWAKVTDGRRGYSLDEFLARVAKLKPGQLWRHNQAGDLPHTGGKISRRFIVGMTEANRGKRGFTFSHHKLTLGDNFKLIKFANDNGFKVNVSTETEAAADSAITLGLPAVLAVDSAENRLSWKTENGNSVVVCPAQTRDEMNCKRCQLCHHRPPNLIVAFKAHGSSVKKANAAIRGVN